MIGRRSTTFAASAAAFIGLAIIAALVLIVQNHHTTVSAGHTPARGVSPAAAVASRPPIAQPTPTAKPTVVAEPVGQAQPAVAQPHPTAAPVALDAVAKARPGVVVRVASLQEKNVTSKLPGETSGASYVVTVTVTNQSASPVTVAGAVVNLFVGRARTPAVETTSASTPVAVRIGAHASAQGTYVFRRPAGATAPLRVEVDLGATSTVVPFQGPAPSAR
ncbi:hypothetical protein [Nocardioides sp.]|uniref:hypothetical protein n=1 Tax=Nocardioides sp. TaxID=35761 RepID=UPI0026317C41|nr:hypothetical protein [Nocardioides sp.]